MYSRLLTRATLTTGLAALLAGCSLLDDGQENARGKGPPPPPSVIVDTVAASEISSSIEAVGTAYANEQADLNSTVTERVARIRYSDGQYVPKGAVIAELVRAQQGATLAANEARLREAEQQLARLQQLQAQGFATRARVDEQQAAVDVARAQASQAGSQIADRVIRAPFSGYLSLRRISPGEVVTSGTTLATIIDHSQIKLDFTVPETHLAALQQGLAIEARTNAWPGEVFRGTIATIDPRLDPVTRAATARAILPNKDLRLRPGMLMTVDIQSKPRTVLAVPELAVIGEGPVNYTWKVDAENNATRVNLQIGARRDGKVEILSGLKAGDRIVTEGSVKMRGPGKVTPVTPAEFAAAQAQAVQGQTASASPAK